MKTTWFIRYRAKRVPVTVLSALPLGGRAVGPDCREVPPVDTGRGWTQPAHTDGAQVDLSVW